MAKVTKAMREALRAIGAIGGKKAAGAGVKALNAKRSPQQRSEAAGRASRARWADMSKEERSAFMKKIRKGKKKGKSKRGKTGRR